MGIDFNTAAFLFMGFMAVFLSSVLVTRRYPVSAAMMLTVVFMLLAGMYGMLDAHFSAVAQIVVYAGAIMVVFIFVIMLLNLPPEDLRFGRMTIGEWVLAAVGGAVAVFFGTRIGKGYIEDALTFLARSNPQPPYYPESANQNLKNVAALMFTDYLWPFELVSFLILAGVIGAIVISKRRKVHVHPHAS